MSLLISIIVPVYNAERFLKRCLDSIVNQTYKELEIILIDDGSIDTSLCICESYASEDSRIKVIHQENSGVSSARNSGLKIAIGDYISFIDPDDWIELDMYESLVLQLTDISPDILRFNAYRKGEIVNKLPFQGNYLNEKLEQEVMLPLIGSEKFGGMFILGVLWLHLYRRELIEKNEIRFDSRLKRCEDRLFTLTAALHADSIIFCKNILYHYEVYDDSLSNKYDPDRWSQELLYLDLLQKEYNKCKNQSFIKRADNRVLNEYLLRAITSINNDFFSKNSNSFKTRYKSIKQIISHPKVQESVLNISYNSIGIKGKLTLFCIQKKQAFLLCVFNTLILYKNKIYNG